MKITRAVVTAASPRQRSLPLQLLVDRDGVQKSVLDIILSEARDAGIEECAVVVCPGDEEVYRKAARAHAERLTLIPQPEPRGYGHAIYQAAEFTGDEPFLHIIGDHVYVSDSDRRCARQIVEQAAANDCAVSGVQATRENLLPLFGAVGGRRVRGSQDLFETEQVMEKPTPTQAEQALIVPGLRAGHYLTFFGMHVLTPAVMELLGRECANPDARSVGLSPALNELAKRERYLAHEACGRRYPLDTKYGLLTAQLALGLSGADREEVLASVCELLAQRKQVSANG